MSSLYQLQKFIMKRKATLSLTGADLEAYESILLNAMAVENEEKNTSQHKLDIDFLPTANVLSALRNDGFTIQDTPHPCVLSWTKFLTTAHK